jgi:hypothetical protein
MKRAHQFCWFPGNANCSAFCRNTPQRRNDPDKKNWCGLKKPVASRSPIGAKRLPITCEKVRSPAFRRSAASPQPGRVNAGLRTLPQGYILPRPRHFIAAIPAKILAPMRKNCLT